MKKILFLLPSLALASWTNFPEPRGQAASREDCERVFGGECYELPTGALQDEVVLADKRLVSDQLLVDQKHERLQVEAQAAQAERETKELKLSSLKSIVETKDPSKEELRDALMFLLEEIGDSKRERAIKRGNQ